MIRFYVAAPFAWKYRARELAVQLADLGNYESVARWIVHHNVITKNSLADMVLHGQYADQDVDDVLKCDLLILLEEDINTLSHGREVEFGIAIASGATIWLVGRRENIFHYLPYHYSYDRIRHFNNVEEMLEYARTART